MNMDFRSPFIGKMVDSLPYFKGSSFVYSLLFKCLPKSLRVCQLKVGSLITDLSDPVQYSLVKLRKGLHELGSVNFINNYLKEGDVFVDIGANFGYFSAVASKKVGGNGLILAFEPNLVAYARLLNTISVNKLHNVIPLNIALGKKANCRISLKKSFLRQTTSSFTIEGEKVLSNTLDEQIKFFSKSKKIKAIKIDVEGAELQVLLGMNHILREHKPYLMIEVDENSEKRYGYIFDEIISYLAEFNYKPVYLLETNSPGRILEYDPELKQYPVVFMSQNISSVTEGSE